MKNGFIFCTVVCAAVLFTGCPYSSRIYLSEPSIEPEEGFYGSWALRGEYEFPPFCEIRPLDKKKFAFDKYEWDSAGQNYRIEASYEAWFTDISGTRFMNVVNITDRTVYYFFRVDLNQTESLVLYEVTDNIDESFSKQEEMSAFFRKNKDSSFFYNNGEETYLKSPKSLIPE